MVSKVSKAMVGKMARACDSCIRKQARWYCAADDAFLCQSCDGSVHSANPMARRHERVRLKDALVEPPWTTGFTKKSRTPRRKSKYEGRVELVDDRVPELGGDEMTSYDELSEEHEQDKEQNVMYRVPFIGNENNVIEFDDFGGDVESLSLLGFDMELVNYGDELNEGFGSGRVKIENQEDEMVEMEMDVGVNEVDMEREAIFEVNYGSYDPLMLMKESSEEFEVGDVKKNALLALNYEGVIAAWADDRSPWTTGDRPEVQPNHGWPDLGVNNEVIYYAYEDTTNGRTCGLPDGGREARVSRYREKRRNRLFSKKIRYEVRKLNAEKRPRMKGRFVKRSSFVPTESPRA